MDKVVVTRRLPGDAVDRLGEKFDVTVSPYERNLSYGELNEICRGAAGAITMLSDRVDREFIESHPELKVVSNYAVGYNNIDLAAAAANGVTVANTPGVLTEATADIAWLLILAVGRRIAEADRYTRAGKFAGWAPELFLGRDIYGATLGIVGMGRIGQATARRALGFEMEILYFSREAKPEVEKQLGARRVELDELMRRADYISLHTPLSRETKHLIDERRIGLMKPTAFLINTARGPVVDESALVRALRNGKISGAGFDVYHDEPVLTPGLTELDNTVLLPHIGSGSHATRRKMAEIAAKNLSSVLEGRTPPHPVSS
ncbi:MAG: D-glycerate dehydrogenase [Candidatus Glassbacteria bacterium]|nr:D-glycerate dehydrogenase [Candidatus Glassbacteria bacterium]